MSVVESPLITWAPITLRSLESENQSFPETEFWFFPLYEQDVRDQVGAETAEVRVDPEVLKVETCFTGSSAPHLGHTGGAWLDDRIR